MSEVKVATRHLVGMMEDLTRTACKERDELPSLSAVLLSSDHADVAVEDEEGGEGLPLVEEFPRDVLVGTSTNTTIMGQAHAPCDGLFHRVVLVSVRDATAIKDVFKPLAKTAGSEKHMTRMVLSGDVLTVSEDPEQVPGGMVLSMQVMDPEGFPLTGVMEPDLVTEVTVRQEGSGGLVVVPPAYGTGVSAEHLLVLGAVAKRRAMPLVWYRHHQSRGVVVTVGAWYRAVVQPVALDPGEVEGPLVPVFRPPFPVVGGEPVV